MILPQTSFDGGSFSWVNQSNGHSGVAVFNGNGEFIDLYKYADSNGSPIPILFGRRFVLGNVDLLELDTAGRRSLRHFRLVLIRDRHTVDHRTVVTGPDYSLRRKELRLLLSAQWTIPFALTTGNTLYAR